MKTIPFDAQFETYRKLANIAEPFALARELSAGGFGAHEEWIRFKESFCDGIDKTQYREYLAEKAREEFGGVPFIHQGAYGGYVSPTLEQQREQLRSRVSGAHDSSALPRWESEITACERNFYWRLNKDPGFDQEFAAYKERLDQRVRQEATALAMGEYSRLDFSEPADRLTALRTIYEQVLSPLGFSYDATRSATRYPVFSTGISADLSLCFGLGDCSMFLNEPTGSADLMLYVATRGLKGHLDGRPRNRWFWIRIGTLVPGFLAAYRRYGTFAELELVIRAFVELYRLVESPLLAILNAGLAKSAT